MVTVKTVNQSNGSVKTYSYSFGSFDVVVSKCLKSSKENNLSYFVTDGKYFKVFYKGKITTSGKNREF